MTSLLSDQELREALEVIGGGVCSATLADDVRVEFIGAITRAPAESQGGALGSLGDAQELKFVTADCPGLESEDEVFKDGARYEIREVRPGQSGLSRAAVKLIRGALPV